MNKRAGEGMPWYLILFIAALAFLLVALIIPKDLWATSSKFINKSTSFFKTEKELTIPSGKPAAPAQEKQQEQIKQPENILTLYTAFEYCRQSKGSDYICETSLNYLPENDYQVEIFAGADNELSFHYKQISKNSDAYKSFPMIKLCRVKDNNLVFDSQLVNIDNKNIQLSPIKLFVHDEAEIGKEGRYVCIMEKTTNKDTLLANINIKEGAK